MNFEELLKNLEEDSKYPIDKRSSKNPQLAFTLIAKNRIDSYVQGKKAHHKDFVNALSEWAMDWLIIFDFNRPLIVKEARIHEYNLLREIAVACLGEKEIIKRLSELK